MNGSLVYSSWDVIIEATKEGNLNISWRAQIKALYLYVLLLVQFFHFALMFIGIEVIIRGMWL